MEGCDSFAKHLRPSWICREQDDPTCRNTYKQHRLEHSKSRIQTMEITRLVCIDLLDAICHIINWMQLAGSNHSHAAWTTLATMFDSQTAAQEDFLDEQWRDLRKGSYEMVDFIHSVKRLTNNFPHIDKPKTMAQINRCIMTSLRLDWESLVLALSPHWRWWATTSSPSSSSRIKLARNSLKIVITRPHSPGFFVLLQLKSITLLVGATYTQQALSLVRTLALEVVLEEEAEGMAEALEATLLLVVLLLAWFCRERHLCCPWSFQLFRSGPMPTTILHWLLQPKLLI